MAQKHKEANERLIESTKNTLKKYDIYLDLTEDIVNYLISMIQKEQEIASTMMENAYLS